MENIPFKREQYSSSHRSELLGPSKSHKSALASSNHRSELLEPRPSKSYKSTSSSSNHRSELLEPSKSYKNASVNYSRQSKSPLIISPQRKKRIDDFIKNRSAIKIQKIMMPFINRICANINCRIEYYTIVNKYIKDISNDQCIIRNEVNQLSIDNKIHLIKQIGTKSKNGRIFICKGIKGKGGELFKFAAKIMKITDENTLEINLLEELTSLVIKKINPYFPIMYKNFICLNTYYINLNEIASGDLRMFMESRLYDNKKLYSSLAQIFLAILSFHNLGYLHNDCHYGNFLFHRVKPGGYIEHILDDKKIYIENMGFLWIIWDFGKTTIYEDNSMKYIVDYHRILHSFINRSNHGWLDDTIIIPEECKELINYILILIKTIIKILPQQFTEIFESDAKII